MVLPMKGHTKTRSNPHDRMWDEASAVALEVYFLAMKEGLGSMAATRMQNKAFEEEYQARVNATPLG